MLAFFSGSERQKKRYVNLSLSALREKNDLRRKKILLAVLDVFHFLCFLHGFTHPSRIGEKLLFAFTSNLNLSSLSDSNTNVIVKGHMTQQVSNPLCCLDHLGFLPKIPPGNVTDRDQGS